MTTANQTPSSSEPSNTERSNTEPSYCEPSDERPDVDTAYRRERIRWRELGMRAVPTVGLTVLVPQQFSEWGERQRSGYLLQRRVFATEGAMVTFAYDTVQEKGRGVSEEDPWEIAASVISAAMALSRHGASRLVATAVEMCERLPRTAALLVAGWIGLQSAHLITDETRIVDDDKVDELDQFISERLAPTRRRTHAPRLGPLRKMLDKAIKRCDPVGAAARARQARSATDVRCEPIGDDQALITATVSGDVGMELMDRIEAMARTAASDDTRTFGQLRAAGLLALCRGWSCLPAEDGSHPSDPGAERASRRVVLHAYEVDGEVTLGGFGAVTQATASDLDRTLTRRVERVSDLADRNAFGALRYSPSDALRAFCRGRDGTCVFPGCQIDAGRCQLDHIVPFDHSDPARGGRTTSDDLGSLCGGHHRLKTAGIWAYYRDEDGSYVWLHGPDHPVRDPGTQIRVEPHGPLARYGRPHDPSAAERQRVAAESGQTGRSTGGAQTGVRGGRVRRPHLRERRVAERRRLRAHAMRDMRADKTTDVTDVTANVDGTSGSNSDEAYEPPPF